MEVKIDKTDKISDIEISTDRDKLTSLTVNQLKSKLQEINVKFDKNYHPKAYYLDLYWKSITNKSSLNLNNHSHKIIKETEKPKIKFINNKRKRTENCIIENSFQNENMVEFAKNDAVESRIEVIGAATKTNKNYGKQEPEESTNSIYSNCNKSIDHLQILKDDNFNSMLNLPEIKRIEKNVIPHNFELGYTVKKDPIERNTSSPIHMNNHADFIMDESHIYSKIDFSIPEVSKENETRNFSCKVSSEYNYGIKGIISNKNIHNNNNVFRQTRINSDYTYTNIFQDTNRNKNSILNDRKFTTHLGSKSSNNSQLNFKVHDSVNSDNFHTIHNQNFIQNIQSYFKNEINCALGSKNNNRKHIIESIKRTKINDINSDTDGGEYFISKIKKYKILFIFLFAKGFLLYAIYKIFKHKLKDGTFEKLTYIDSKTLPLILIGAILLIIVITLIKKDQAGKNRNLLIAADSLTKIKEYLKDRQQPFVYEDAFTKQYCIEKSYESDNFRNELLPLIKEVIKNDTEIKEEYIVKDGSTKLIWKLKFSD